MTASVFAVRVVERFRVVKVLATQAAHVLAGVAGGAGYFRLSAVVDENGVHHCLGQVGSAGFHRVLGALVGAGGAGNRVVLAGGHADMMTQPRVAYKRGALCVA